jgi:RimJ/RimL family protein N-acetyltransferase
MQFIELKPSEMAEEDWKLYLDSRERIHFELDPNDPSPSHESRRSYMLSPHPDYELSWWQAKTDSGEVVGMGGVWWARESAPNYEGEKDTAYADMILEEEFTNEKSQTDFLSCLVRKANQLGKQKLVIETRTEHQYSFFEAFGCGIVSKRATHRLLLSDVDLQMIARWRRDGSKRTPKVRIEQFSSVPEQNLEEYCKLYTETWNQAPLEDASPEMIVTPENRRKMESYFQSQGEIWTTMISREPDGAISGLTEIWYQREKWHLIEQGLTGVSRQYRKRGLGKWLKAEMLTYAMNEYPRALVVETGNADANAPMLSINQRMGFKAHRKMWILSFDVANLLTLV